MNKIDMEEKLILLQDLSQDYGLGEMASNACANDILDLFSDVEESTTPTAMN